MAKPFPEMERALLFVFFVIVVQLNKSVNIELKNNCTPTRGLNPWKNLFFNSYPYAFSEALFVVKPPIMFQFILHLRLNAKILRQALFLTTQSSLILFQ